MIWQLSGSRCMAQKIFMYKNGDTHIEAVANLWLKLNWEQELKKLNIK